MTASEKVKMKTHKQVLANTEARFDLSLAKIMGKEVVDIVGYISTEFGDPVFKIGYVAFKDGSTTYAEGEHDMKRAKVLYFECMN